MAAMFEQNPPLSLYIHIPWCVRKCPYCDFNSHEIKNGIPEEQYIDSLMRDLEQSLPLIWGRSIQTVFFGGGTPSSFSAAAIDQILCGVRSRIKLSPNAEITLEANPGTTEQSSFSDLKATGINRISIGIQSFDDLALKRLGRIHSSQEAKSAIEAARNAGFDNINLDLMFGLPKQSLDKAITDLEYALGYAPEHLSYYQLTLEPNTAFAHSPPTLPVDAIIEEIHETGLKILESNGYSRYEVSAFAAQGRQCRHNLNYWRFGDYIGIGAGAHSKITHIPDKRVIRQWKHKHPNHYMDSTSTFIQGERDLTSDDLSLEFMMNALRLSDGFEFELFSQRTGLPLSEIEDKIHQAKQAGLLRSNPIKNCLQATPRGFHFLNDLLAYFIADE